MGFHNIEKKSFWYNILYHYVAFWHNKIFYRKIVKLNEDNIPEKDPAIFTPNHQNALMDALAMLFTVKRQLVFMARSDIFKKFAPILYFLKILPIYRIRDGIDSLKNNKKVFDKTVEVLNANNGLVILPEGSHKWERKLRQLKKGFARIAFQTQLSGTLKAPLKIIPVGIDYDDYIHCRSRLLVNFGEPFEISRFLDEYEKNPATALNRVKEELSKRMKKLIIHIESKKHYDFINEWRVYYRNEMCLLIGSNPSSEADGFFADQQLVKMLDKTAAENPEIIERMESIYNNILKKLKQFDLKITDLNANVNFFFLTVRFFLLTIFFPFFIYGAINHVFPFFLPYYISRKVEDVTFHSSFMFVLTMLFFPVFYFIQSLIVFFLFTGETALLYLLSLPLSAAISWKWSKHLKEVLTNFKLFKFSNTAEFKLVKVQINLLKELTADIVKKHLIKFDKQNF